MCEKIWQNIKSDFDVKLGSLKTLLLDKITDFKQDFTCENADKMSELKFSVENLYNKNLPVEILTKIRNEQKFKNIDELKAQIEKDVKECLK